MNLVERLIKDPIRYVAGTSDELAKANGWATFVLFMTQCVSSTSMMLSTKYLLTPNEPTEVGLVVGVVGFVGILELIPRVIGSRYFKRKGERLINTYHTTNTESDLSVNYKMECLRWSNEKYGQQSVLRISGPGLMGLTREGLNVFRRKKKEKQVSQKDLDLLDTMSNLIYEEEDMLAPVKTKKVSNLYDGLSEQAKEYLNSSYLKETLELMLGLYHDANEGVVDFLEAVHDGDEVGIRRGNELFGNPDDLAHYWLTQEEIGSYLELCDLILDHDWVGCDESVNEKKKSESRLAYLRLNIHIRDYIRSRRRGSYVILDFPEGFQEEKTCEYLAAKDLGDQIGLKRIYKEANHPTRRVLDVLSQKV